MYVSVYAVALYIAYGSVRENLEVNVFENQNCRAG